MSARDPSAKLSNNTNESGILIYNKIEKASSTTVASYMFKFAAQNNNTHKHCPFGHFYMTDNMKTEREFLKKHYDYPKKPFSTDQHIVFVNAVEDYGFEEYERPNWINFVRQPIERLVSQFYFFKEPQENPNTLLTKVLKEIAANNTGVSIPKKDLVATAFKSNKIKNEISKDRQKMVSTKCCHDTYFWLEANHS